MWGTPLAPYVSQAVGKNCDLLVLNHMTKGPAAKTFIGSLRPLYKARQIAVLVQIK